MSTKLLPAEVTLRCEDAVVNEWDMPIGDPFIEEFSPVLLFLAADVHHALRQGTVTFPSGDTFHVSRDGYATCTRAGTGRSAVYELFAARLDDERPYTPILYVGRWPD